MKVQSLSVCVPGAVRTKLQADFEFENGGSDTMNTETTNNREELDREELVRVKEGLLQAVFELASAYETGAITSERFAEKVCGLRNIYQKEIEEHEVHSQR